MKVRSTGLGDSELVMSISEVKRNGDCLVLEGKSSEPVTWHIRMAVSYRDMLGITRFILIPKNLLFLIWKIITPKRAYNISWPQDF